MYVCTCTDVLIFRPIKFMAFITENIGGDISVVQALLAGNVKICAQRAPRLWHIMN